MEIILREERPGDYKTVEELTREAFWNVHTPGCCEHYLLHILRESDCFIKELDIVAETEGCIIGNIVYTKAKIISDNGDWHEVISFGPISVLPEFQGKGIGSLLIETTKKKAIELGHKVIVIYGDPEYYKRFGFKPAENFKIATADNMYGVSLQALELIPGALEGIEGRFFEDEAYDVQEDAAKEFDMEFKAKEPKDDLPCQKRFRFLVNQRVAKE